MPRLCSAPPRRPRAHPATRVLVAALVAAPAAPAAAAAAQAAPGGPRAGEAAAAARPRRPLDLAVRVNAGTLGVGVEVAKLVASRLAVRVGAQGFSYGRAQEFDGVTYDARARLRTATVLLDLYPARRGSFHVTGGAIVGTGEITGTGVPEGGYYVNGTEYSAQDVGALRGAVTFPRVRPYAGLGWGTPANRGTSVRLVLDLGVALGTPAVTLAATNAEAGSALSADLEAQRASAQQDADTYLRLYPVMSTGLSVRF
jgi:hypothetical protein